MGKIDVITSESWEVTGKGEQEYKMCLENYFPEGAYVYAVLDYAVVLGRYYEGKLQAGFAMEQKVRKLPWENVRQLRVFTQQKELKILRQKDEFAGRMREDKSEKPENIKCYKQDEVQKLWGKKDGCNIQGFHMLSSRRGTRILVPIDLENHKLGTAGIKVRNYLSFPDASREEGLFLHTDNRLVDICLWPEEGRADGEF